MAEAQAGWYPDPSGDATKLRYWDGAKWTDDYTQAQPAQASAAAPQGACQTGGASGQPYAPQPAAAAGSDQTLYLIAFIFCIVSTVVSSWMVIPLAWMIPMTVHCWGIYKGTKRNTTAFGVCTLLFVSLVSGILLLVGKKD